MLAYTRNGMRGSELFRQKTAQHVDLITVCCCDSKVSRTDTGFNKHRSVYCIPDQTEYIEFILQVCELFFIMVDRYDLMPFLSQLFYKKTADFSGPNHDDLHFFCLTLK